MSDSIGRITVPDIISSGLTFPLVSDMGYGFEQAQPIVTHRFGTLDAKLEQRYLVGLGPRKFSFKRANLSFSNRNALISFWESLQGPWKSFTYNVPGADQSTTAVTVVWEQTPLSIDYLVNACKVGFNFVEIPDPTTAPTYSVAATVTRFPSTTLANSLTGQVQKLIPLIHIKARESGVSEIFLSDRRCTIGGQVYLPRVLALGEEGSDVIVSQNINGAADDVQFTFGNADQVMTNLANDTDLKYSNIDLSFYDITTGILIQLWAGFIQTFSVDGSPNFVIRASDGIFQINQQHPPKTVSRTCWKTFNDGLNCPFATQGASSAAVIAAGGDPATCDYYWNSANGCQVHGMGNFFGGIPILPQSVSIKDNSTGFIGFDRNTVTATSIISDTIWGKALAEIWCNQNGNPINAFIANCLIAAVRDNGDFFDVLGIIGCGPLGGGVANTAFTINSSTAGMFVTNADGFTYLLAPLADNTPAQGLKIASSGTSTSKNTSLGLRQVPGYTSISPVGDQSFNVFALANIVGKVQPPFPFAPETAFCELLYPKVSGITPSATDSHSMTVPIAQGLTGFTWDASDTRSSVGGLTNPFWITINTFLRALGFDTASSAAQEALFVRSAIFKGDGTGCAEIADTTVTPILGVGTETQFQFQGSLGSQKPLRDWLVEILNTGLGFFTWEFGKLKLGCRINASSVDAYTLGNIKFQSLNLTPFDATFEHLIIDFADVAYQYQANTAEYNDKDHAAYYGRSGAPLTSRMHSLGSPTLSQNLRIAATRTREELGGVNAAEWRNARNASWQTTLLGLSNEVGQVVSVTDPVKIPGLRGTCNVSGTTVTWVSGDPFDPATPSSMVNKEILIGTTQVTVVSVASATSLTISTSLSGSGLAFKVITMDFRIQSWQLRKDYSIAITGKTVVPSMYNLDVGPKPADVIPQPLPVLFYGIPLELVWCPFQLQFPSSDVLFPNEWTYDIDQEYVDAADVSSIATLTLAGKLPANQFSPGCPAPQIGNVAQSSTGGSIPSGALVKVCVTAIDANGLPSPSSSIMVVAIAPGTNTNSISLQGITWPEVAGLASYVVFAGTMDDLICAQVTGALTAVTSTTYTPTTLSLTGLQRGTWSLPSPYLAYVKPKAKICIHSGSVGANVDSVTTGHIVASELVDTTGGAFNPVGRVLSIIGRPTGSTPLYNGTVTSWAPLTGTLGLTPDPHGIVLANDTLAVRFQATSTTPLSVADSNNLNATNGYSGLTASGEKGLILRVTAGTGRGQIRKLTDNTTTGWSWDVPLTLDLTSVWIIEASTWTFTGDGTAVQNADPLASCQLSIPIQNFKNTCLLTSVFTVNTGGVESADGDQPVREEWIYGSVGSGSGVAPTILPVTPVSLAKSYDSNGNVLIAATYTPPSDALFMGVVMYAEEPDFSGSVTAFQLDVSTLDGTAGAVAQARIPLGKFPLGPLDGSGNYTVNLPPQTPPTSSAFWRIYWCSYGANYDQPIIDATLPGASPSLTINVIPNPAGGLGEEYAPLVTGLTVATPVTQPSQGNYEYEVTVTWVDPTVAANQSSIESYSGVNLQFAQLLGAPKTYFVPAGQQTFTIPWAQIPVVQQLWSVKALSVSKSGKPNTYSLGVTPEAPFATPPLQPATPGGTALADVTNFAMGARYGYDPNGSGNYDLIIQPTFTPPNDPMWQAISVVVEAPAGSANYVALDPAKYGNGDTHDLTLISPSGFPTSPQTWNAWAISIDVNDRLKYPDWKSGVFGTAPTYSFTVGITTNPGTAEEFSGLVTSFSAGVSYSVSADGLEVFSFNGLWDDSTDVRFAGVRPTVFYVGSTQPINLGDVGPGVEGFTTDSWPVPTSSVGGTLYFLSIDSSGRANPIAAGTPFFNFIITAQTAGVILANRLKPSTIGPGLQPLAGQLAAATGSGLALSAGDIVAATGDGITVTGGNLVTNTGDGLTTGGGKIIFNPGGGLGISGGKGVANLGSGLGLSGSNIVPNTGGVVSIVGGNIVINLGAGISNSAGSAVVNTGSGLTFSGSQVVVNPDGTSLVLTAGKVGILSTWVYPGTLVANQIVGGSITASVSINMVSGGVTVNIDATNFVKVTSTNVCQITGVQFIVGNGTHSGFLEPSEVSVSGGSGSIALLAPPTGQPSVVINSVPGFTGSGAFTHFMFAGGVCMTAS